MDHAEAIKVGAVERYLLDELPAPDRDRFEEHYFGCSACADDVKVTATFIHNLRSVLRDPYPIATPRSAANVSGSLLGWFWPARMAFAATIALFAIVAYQNVVTIPGMRHDIARSSGPQAYAQHFLTQDRSPANNVIEVPRGADRVSMLFSKIPDRPARFYRCQLKDASGRNVSSFAVPAPEAEEWQLLLPVKDLSTGQYVLDVSTSDTPDGAAQPLAQYHFQLVTK
jgi:hypothetical protein